MVMSMIEFEMSGFCIPYKLRVDLDSGAIIMRFLYKKKGRLAVLSIDYGIRLNICLFPETSRRPRVEFCVYAGKTARGICNGICIK